MNIPVDLVDTLNERLSAISEQISAARDLLDDLKVHIPNEGDGDASSGGSNDRDATTPAAHVVDHTAPPANVDSAENLSGGANSLVRALSPRHIELLKLMNKGLNDVEAAVTMGIKATTIRQVKQTMYRRLGVHNVMAALNAARQLGLLSEAVDPMAVAPTDNEQPHQANSIQRHKWPDKAVVLYSHQSGSFLFVDLPEETKPGKAIACFKDDESAGLFVRFNREARGCTSMCMNIRDIEKIARNQESDDARYLMLLDDPDNPDVVSAGANT